MQMARVMIVAHSVERVIKGHMGHRDHLVIRQTEIHIMVGMVVMTHITKIEEHLVTMMALRTVVTRASLEGDALIEMRRAIHVDNLVIIATDAQIM